MQNTYLKEESPTNDAIYIYGILVIVSILILENSFLILNSINFY